MYSEKVYQVALSNVEGIGDVAFGKLIQHFESAQNVFNAPLEYKIKALGKKLGVALQSLKENGKILQAAHDLILQHAGRDIDVCTRCQTNYPERLEQLYDAPAVLYSRGDLDLNASRIISVVGTRTATPYGKRFVAKILEELASLGSLVVISGLAYGIDIEAHRVALSLGLPTGAVLAGGLDHIYPAAHKPFVAKMLARQGALLSQHAMGVKPEPYRFAARNRIIAGLADATLVIEADRKSGALITARHANAYDRQVFALPGDIYSGQSAGCHHLIKTNQAHLVTEAADVLYHLHWQNTDSPSKSPDRKSPCLSLTSLEQKVVDAIAADGPLADVESVSRSTTLELSQLASVLLELEMKRVIRCMPGRKLTLCSA